MNSKTRQQIASSVSRAAHSVRFAWLEKLESRQLLSAGDLDPTFGNAGWAVSGNLGTGGTTVDAVVQSDGKVLEAISEPGNQFAVERLTASGAVDTTYGTAGTTSIDFGGDPINESIGKLLVLADGSAIVAGATRTSFVLIHLTASGAIDSTFGSAGLATANVNGSNPAVNDLALQYNGKILVGGTGQANLALARFNPNGALDKSFNSTGIVLQNLPGNHEGINALAIQPDGRIIAAGYATDTYEHEQNAVIRFLSNGTLDSTFCSTGYHSFGAEDMQLSGVGLTADGKIIIASTSTVSFTSHIDVYRLNADGSTDTTYGTGGSTKFATPTTVSGGTSITAINAAASKLVIQSDGKVVIAGRIENAKGMQYAAAFRLNTDGTPDATYGNEGIVAFQLYESNMPNSIVITADGKIVLSDATVVAANDATEIGVVRLTSTGALDTTFGIGGKATNDLTGKLAAISAMLTLPNGQILAAGWTESPRNGSKDFMVMRLNRDGSIDTTFGQDGFTTIDFDNYTDEADSIALQSDGKIIVAGRAHSAPEATHTWLAVVRLNVDGSLDTTFGVGGKVTVVASDEGITGMVVLGDDSIVASNDGILVKFSKNGTVDPNYGATVIPGNYPTVQQMLLKSEGKILLNTYDGMMRLNAADGSLDSSFGTDGVIPYLSGPILSAANGEFLLATPSGLSRYLADGALDTSFGTAGTAAYPTADGDVRPVAMQFTPDGKIAIESISGNSSGSTGDQALSVLVLHADGSADISFDDGTISNPSSGFLNSGQTNYPAVIAVESDDSILAAANVDGSSQGWDIAKIQGDFAISDPHVTFSNNGTLTISGTNDGDSISVALSKDSSEVLVWVDGAETKLLTGSVEALSISALDGDDTIYASINVPTTINGGAGNDIITTGNMSSVLHGGDGDDTITGGNAADSLYGDAGNDSINGGDGTDYLSGSDGNDILNGGGGNDTLDGGLGADQLWGGKGTDTADYHARSENLNISLNDVADDGAPGEMDNVHSDIENILGGMSADVITGDKYANSLVGNGGADTIYGGSGNDTLNGGAGKDRLYGQNGDDVFIANDGNRDTLDGGAGTDSASRDHSSTVADDVLNIEKFI